MAGAEQGLVLSPVPPAGLGDTWDTRGPARGHGRRAELAHPRLPGKEQKKESLLAVLLEVA